MEQGTHLDAAGVGAATATRERASRARQRASRTRDTTAKSPALPTNVRVAIYLRISTDEEHQPFSLDAQRHRLESFIPTQPGWSHVATYEDQTSGAKASRPDLDRAMRDARLGRFDVLLVYRVDRFARSLKVLVHLLEELEGNGVAFRSATEPIDTSTATGRMLVQLLGVFAEFERATIIDRVVNGMERKAARGGWPGGPLPHGLALDDNDHLAVRAEEFPLVERIFARYAEGDTGAVGIATELNEDGHRTRNGRLWSAKGVLDILRNRSYVGEVHWRGSWYRSSDPLIDAELFERVQALLNERGEGYDRRFTARHPEYLLTGLVKCGRCNRAYVGVSAHGKKHRYRYYVCWSRARYGASGCEGERLRADELEMAVFDALAAMYENPDLLREAVAAQVEDAEASAQRQAEELATLEAEIAKTEASVERYMLAFENGTITEDMFGERVRDLGTKAAALRARRDDLRTALDASGRSPLPTAEEIAALRDSLRDAAQHASDAVRKLITQAFVHELRVVSRDQIDPMFRVLRCLPYMPDGAGQASDPAGTGVRAMTPNVEVKGFEPTKWLFTALRGSTSALRKGQDGRAISARWNEGEGRLAATTQRGTNGRSHFAVPPVLDGVSGRREQSTAEPVRSLEVRFGRGLRAEREGEPGVGVTQPVLCRLHVDVEADHLGGVHAPQVVEADGRLGPRATRSHGVGDLTREAGGERRA